MQNSTPTSYVYIIRQGESRFYKVGFSTYPERRLRQLQTSNPHALAFVFVWEAPQEFEDSLHRAYAAFRKEGEWFELTDAQIREIEAAYQRHRRYQPKPTPSLSGWLPDSLDQLHPAMLEITRTDDLQRAKALASRGGSVPRMGPLTTPGPRQRRAAER